MYELSRANPTSTEEITVTITSKPIDGVDAIEVNFRTDETNIQFSPMTMVRRIIHGSTIANNTIFMVRDVVSPYWSHLGIALYNEIYDGITGITLLIITQIQFFLFQELPTYAHKGNNFYAMRKA